MTAVDVQMTCHFVIIVIDKRPQLSGWHSYCLSLPITSGGDMHEITLCQRALELIEQQAVAHGAKRITGVWLKIGAFSCVETSALSFCFDLVCRGTVAEGCKLHLEEQEAECWCESCQQYVTLLTQRVRRCPQCNSDTLQIVADDGLQIRRIEIDQE
jgi:hydrogenase nickel incorporation protein HypA/HybF